jgi:hypothetical protein
MMLAKLPSTIEILHSFPANSGDGSIYFTAHQCGLKVLLRPPNDLLQRSNVTPLSPCCGASLGLLIEDIGPRIAMRICKGCKEEVPNYYPIELERSRVTDLAVQEAVFFALIEGWALHHCDTFQAVFAAQDYLTFAHSAYWTWD